MFKDTRIAIERPMFVGGEKFFIEIRQNKYTFMSSNTIIVRSDRTGRIVGSFTDCYYNNVNELRQAIKKYLLEQQSERRER